MHIKISYYDLLGLVAKNEEPKKIKLNLISGVPVEYVAAYDNVSDEFTNYEIKCKNDQTEDYKFYLGDCFLESDMFNKCIEIIEEDKEIEPLNKVRVLNGGNENEDMLFYYCVDLERKQKELIEAVNELKKGK